MHSAECALGVAPREEAKERKGKGNCEGREGKEEE